MLVAFATSAVATVAPSTAATGKVAVAAPAAALSARASAAASVAASASTAISTAPVLAVEESFEEQLIKIWRLRVQTTANVQHLLSQPLYAQQLY
jgi:hypothetical protein